MVHCPSILQAADIMTKPFTNSEKWKFATALLSHVRVDDKGKTIEPNPPIAPSQTSQAASATRDDSTGEPGAGLKPSRLIVEVCCSPDSKLSDCSRQASKGCVVYQFTEDYNRLSEENRAELAHKVNQFPRSKKVLFWLSLPCTGGTTWSYVNMKHPTAKMKVLKEVRKFWKLWEATCNFIDLIEREFDIAMEWPTGCRYWKSRKVRRFLETHMMEKYNFHGCMLGTKNHDGIAIKKPWTVATSIPEIGHCLVKYQCDGQHEHVAGRGIDLKATELYTWDFVDNVHAALQQSTGISRFALPCVRFHPVMSLAIPNYLPASQSDAEKVVAEIVGQTRIEAYEVTKYWEKRLIDLRLGALATAFEDSTEGVEMLGGSQQPVPDLIETTITTDADHTFYSYPEIRNIFRSVPPYYFGVAQSRPEGLVDILLLGDSTAALVHNPGDVYEGSRFSMGELLKGLNIPGVGNIETRLCWGKGLNTIVATAKEAIEAMNHDNFIKGHHSRQILVLVGWSGIHGDYGYQGCSWIHQTR